MKSELFLDAVGLIDEQFVIEAHSVGASRPRREIFIRAVSAALCVMLAATLVIGIYRRADTTDGTQTAELMTAPADSGTLPIAPDSGELPIIWGDGSSGKTQVYSQLGERLSVDGVLANMLGRAADDDIFAVAVAVTPDTGFNAATQARIGMLRDQVDNAVRELSRTAEQITGELVMTGGISLAEASARKFSDERFISARERLRTAKAALASERVTALYAACGDAVACLEENGLILLYDALCESFVPSLSTYGADGAVCVMAATKSQILALANAELLYNCRLYSAADGGDRYVFSDIFTGSEVYFADGTRLTERLAAAYADADGQALDVSVHIAYFGLGFATKEELDAAALMAIGMTRDELDACIDIGAHQRFIGARNRLIYHYEYNSELAQRLFEDGESYEISEHLGAFTARLTYERALQLSQSADVAYIDILG